ncbi:UNKNOWN [Stylonychia lemnae]|uniref:Uncharacterized protein n=1 Tax=Stylonychia lemnae TaxID=5949 RepID=A0A078AL25_STYLE|nr:UNKNOWN [Stylonychia lemnae]|eukprot:CDW81558.1 UNKNOWN [Stylonychia lemnae]
MAVTKNKKNAKNQYGNNRQSKKKMEEQLKKDAEESKANSYFSCNCQVCKQQVTKGHRFEIKKLMDMKLLEGKKTMKFSKLIQCMLPPNEKIKGCQVLFPDTVFFGHGKPQFIAKCDKEGCLMVIQQQSKLALQDIRQKFSTIVRERKKETQPIIFQNNNSLTRNDHNQETNQNTVSFKLPQTSPKSKTSMAQNTTIDEENQKLSNDEKSIFYKDTAVFRFIVDEPQNQQKLSTNNFEPLQDEKELNFTMSNANLKEDEEDDQFSMPAVKVVKDTEFINEFRRRANDEFWRTVDCIQTSIKAKTGIGIPIFVNFLAPINEQDPSKEIDYSHFKVMQEDFELLKNEEDEQFCYKQCLKIAYYVSKVYNKEILQMKAEFLKDENGNIWFFYASNIRTRKTSTRALPAYNMKNSASQKANVQKEQLIAEIDQYEQEQNVNQNKSIGRMLNIMDSYYSNMKVDMGILEKKNYEEEDSKLDEVLRTLRPNTTANNFKEFLSRQDNINKSTYWKNVARKLDDNQQSQQQIYMNKRNITQDSKKNQQIQSLMNALDVSSLGQKVLTSQINTIHNRKVLIYLVRLKDHYFNTVVPMEVNNNQTTKDNENKDLISKQSQ